MPKAIITIEDTEDGSITLAADYGDAIVPESRAHQIADVLVNSVLSNAPSYQTVEDTNPEHNIEPSRIITPDSTN